MSTRKKRGRVGIVGAGKMGERAGLRLRDELFEVVLCDKRPEVAAAAAAAANDSRLTAAATIEELVRQLAPPRIVLCFVDAGPAVDEVLRQLAAARFQPADIFIDFGNSHYTDTIRRQEQWLGRFDYCGSGISGGTQGARYGASLMPGCSMEVWNRIRPVAEALAARVTDLPDSDGGMEEYPCTAWIGPGGAGHFTKMVHNGIEYAMMQLNGEAYALLHDAFKLPAGVYGEIFAEWNRGPLEAFLTAACAEVLRQRDPRDSSRFLIDAMVDQSYEKGTGKATVVSGFDLGIPVPTIGAAVFGRLLSGLASVRRQVQYARTQPPVGAARLSGVPREVVSKIGEALYCAQVTAYAQGFQVLDAASDAMGWNLTLHEIARIWRGGCIIRGRILDDVYRAFRRDPSRQNLLAAESFAFEIASKGAAWREVAAHAVTAGIPAPALLSSIAYYDALTSERLLSAALVQGQRNFFGGHAIELTGVLGRLWTVSWHETRRLLEEIEKR